MRGVGVGSAALTIVVAAALAAAGPAGASAVRCGTGTRSTHMPRDAALWGVAVTSGCTAWAVGWSSAPTRTLIERWNGGTWAVQPSPNGGGPASSNFLVGVAATSRTNAWAVGSYAYGSHRQRPLIEHWDGASWQVQHSAAPGGPTATNDLQGVAATSPTNAWAVGQNIDLDAPGVGLIEHWNGRAWRVQPSPGVPFGWLFGIAATSPANAWAVGEHLHGTVAQTLIEHWNGRSWTVQHSPNRRTAKPGNWLFAVTATSPTNAWAVGRFDNGVASHTLIEHWNGRSWGIQPSPGGSSSVLTGAAAISRTNAWAVGYHGGEAGQGRALILHWDGTSWTVAPAAVAGAVSSLTGAAASPAAAWAVGYYRDSVGPGAVHPLTVRLR